MTRLATVAAYGALALAVAALAFLPAALLFSL